MDTERWAAVAAKVAQTGILFFEKTDVWWTLQRLPIEQAERMLLAPNVELSLLRLLQRMGPSTIPRLTSCAANRVGFSTFTLNQGNVSIEQELLVDTSCALELVLQESIAVQLQLVPKPGSEILITGSGGSVLALASQQDVIVAAVLLDQGTHTYKMTVQAHLKPHVITQATQNPACIPPSEAAPVRVYPLAPRDISATLKLRQASATSVELPEAVTAAGFGMLMLGRRGMEKLGLEVDHMKDHLYAAKYIRSGATTIPQTQGFFLGILPVINPG